MFLGQILRHSGFCSGLDILEALDQQKSGDERKLGSILLALNRISQEELEKALNIQNSIRTNGNIRLS